MSHDDEQRSTLDGILRLYRDVTDGIIRAEQQLKQSRALQDLTIARMVDLVGDTAEVAKLIGGSELYVQYAVFKSGGTISGATKGGSDD